MEKLTHMDLVTAFAEPRPNPNHRGGSGTPSRRAAKLDTGKGHTIRDPDSRKNRRRYYEAVRKGPTAEQRRRHTLRGAAVVLVPDESAA